MLALRAAAFSLPLLLAVATPLSARQTVGMAGLSSGEVVVFDADAEQILGSVSISVVADCVDCAIDANVALGFAVGFTGQLWVIDLSGPVPALAAGTNPIPISNPGEDVTISRDQRFVVVSDGGLTGAPISVVDIAARAEIATYSFAPDCNSIEVGPDGTLLATSVGASDVQRLTIDPLGALAATGEQLDFTQRPNNSYFAPSGAFAVTVLRDLNQVVSYGVPGLAAVDTISLPAPAALGELGICGTFDATGRWLYAMSAKYASTMTVSRHAFDEATGDIEAVPDWTAPFVGGAQCYGVDQIALHPSRDRLFVSRFATDRVEILDASSGASIGALTMPDVGPLGLCLMQRAECYLVVGSGAGSASFEAGGHSWQTQLGTVQAFQPVTLEDPAAFALPPLARVARVPPRVVGEVDLQVLMWNPGVFPTNPEQWSPRLRGRLWSNGRVTATRYGSGNGMDLELEVVRQPDGARAVRVPFTIAGL